MRLIIKIAGNIYVRISFLMILFAASAFLNNITGFKPLKTKLTDEFNNVKYIDMPYSRTPDAGLSRPIFNSLEIYINNNLLLSKKIKVFPDDRVENFKINGQDIDIKIYEKNNRYPKGFVVDLAPHLKNGINIIEIKIADFGGGCSLKIEPFSFLPLKAAAVIFYVLSLCLIFLIIIKRAGAARPAVIILIAGFLLRLYYFSYTDPEERSQDNQPRDGHIGYIKYVADNYKPPLKNQGWIFYHPPFYYIAGAAVYKAFDLLKFNFYEKSRMVQILSVFLFMIFLIYSEKIFRYFFKEQKLPYYLALLLAVFWPSGIIHSARITNDVMFYALSAAGVFYLIRWARVKKIKYLSISAVFACLSLLTKYNGLILIGIIMITAGVEYLLFFIKVFKRKNRFILLYRNLLRLYPVVIIVLIGVLLFVSHGVSDALRTGSFKNFSLFKISIGNLNRNLAVGNNIINYIYFDMDKYFLNSFISTWNDIGGRQYFWNFLLKSSLWGEFFFNAAYFENIAVVVNSLFFAMIMYLLISIFIFRGNIIKSLKKYYVLLLYFVISVLFLFNMRYTAPFACHNDFRFILPILISICVFFAVSMNGYKKNGLKMPFYIGYLLFALFISLSAVFFLKPI